MMKKIIVIPLLFLFCIIATCQEKTETKNTNLADSLSTASKKVTKSFKIVYRFSSNGVIIVTPKSVYNGLGLTKKIPPYTRYNNLSTPYFKTGKENWNKTFFKMKPLQGFQPLILEIPMNLSGGILITPKIRKH